MAFSIEESWQQYYRDIDRLLNEIRPPRAGKSEKEWREPAYGYAANHMPDQRGAVRNLAKAHVDRRETLASRHGNDIIRAYGQGQTPLEWALLGPLPFTIGKLKVRFDAATTEDVEDGAREQELTAKQRYDAELIVIATMRDLARSARRQGYEFVVQLGDLPLRNDDDWVDDDDDDDDDL
jgi:hypothetical protein